MTTKLTPQAAPGSDAVRESLEPEKWVESGLAVLDAEGRVTYLNPPLGKWLNVTVERAAGERLDLLMARTAPECAASLAGFIIEGPACLESCVCEHDSRGSHWFSCEFARNPAGFFVRVQSFLASTQELAESGFAQGFGSRNEQRHMFVRLLRAETQLGNLMQRWPGVIFSQRADFSITYASPKILQMTGVAPGEWRNVPQRFWQVVHEADAEELRRQCRLAAQGQGGISTTYRVRNLQTSQISYVLEHREAVTSKSGMVLGYECFWLDITRQTIAEKRLSSAAWKDTLATLTMGLAHDFGNIMAGILSLSELYCSRTSPTHPFHEGLGLIKQQSMAASQLVRRIVNLHRCKTGERNYHDLNEVTTELMDLVQKVLPRRIQVKTELAPSPLPVYMDGVEFRQVVLNLALNAADAIPQRGSVVLRTRRHTEPERIEHSRGRFPRLPAVSIEVEDTGTGIPARHLPHLFDAFFTTKPVDKGSGLGLYNVRLFVESHAGAVSVTSVEGKGSTFRLWLPEAGFTEQERLEPVAGSRHCVLLAGSAGCLTDSTAEFLRVHEFYVIVATNPERVPALLAEAPHIDLVLVLANPSDPEFLSLLKDLVNAPPKAKLAIQVVGADLDQVDSYVLGKVDLVITNETPEDEFVRKMKALFSTPQPA